MRRIATHRGVSLIETLSVIVIIASIAPVLAMLMSSTHAAHHDSTTTRALTQEARYAIEVAEVRVHALLQDPNVSVTAATTTAVSFSDGSRLSAQRGRLVWSTPGLPDASLADNVGDFELVYADATGTRLDTGTMGFDPDTVHRVGIGMSIDGVRHRGTVYREGGRTYANNDAGHVGNWVESFDDLMNGLNEDEGDTAWSTQLDGHTRADHGIRDGRYLFSMMRPAGRPVTWRSEPVSIDGLGAHVVSLAVDGYGSLDTSGNYRDTLEVIVVLDGVRTTVYSGSGYAPVGQVIQAGPFEGSSIQIEVAAFISGADEGYLIDDVTLAQDTESIWVEWFDDLADGTTSDDGETAWAYDISNTSNDNRRRARIGVFNGELRFSAGGGPNSGYSQFIAWTTEAINISETETASVVVGVRSTTNNNLEESGRWHDWFTVEYSVDGGPMVQSMLDDGDINPNPRTIRIDGIEGDELVIRIRAKTTGDVESYYVDSVSVKEGVAP